MISKNQFEQYVSLFSRIIETRQKLENEYNLYLDGIYDDIYLIIDMVIDSNFDEFGRELFFDTFYEADDPNFEELWEVLKEHYNYEPAK